MEANEAHDRSAAPESVASERSIELGDLSMQSSDLRTAVDHYRSGIRAAGPGTGESRVAALRKLSAALLRLGETAEALDATQQAALAVDAHTSIEEQARVQMQVGRVRMKSGRFEEALDAADAAVRLLQDRGEGSEYGAAVHLKGVIAYRLDRRDLAMRLYQSALRIYKDAGDLVRVARVSVDIGILHKDACNWSRALENYQVAHSLMTNEGALGAISPVHQSLGVVRLRMGQLGESLTHFDRALDAARRVGDPVSAALAMIGQAEVARQRGENDRARELYGNALESCLLRQYPIGSACAYLGIGELALAAGDLEEARRTWAKAREVVERLGRKGAPGLELDLLEAEIALHDGDVPRAQELATSARTESQRMTDRIHEARAMRVIAIARARAGKAAAAADILGAACGILRRVEERYYLAELLEEKGALAFAADDDRKRLEGLQNLLEACECYRTLRLPGREARTLCLIAREDIRQRAVDRASERLEKARALATTLGNPAPLMGEIAEANALLEKSIVVNAVSTIESLNAQREMERVLKSERQFGEKLSEFLRVLGRSIPCDGASVLEVDDSSLRVIGCHEIAVAPGTTISRPRGLAGPDWPANELPVVYLAIDAERRGESLGELAAGRDVSSALVLPLREGKRGWSILYVDRLAVSGNPSFHQAEINHSITLARQLAAFLEEAGIRSKRGLRELDKIERNIALADIVTQNTEMHGILGLVSRVAVSNLTVLLQGETGTGKKLIARALHECSARAGNPFVTVDCAALPEGILESELFGYLKGAFTGAIEDRAGILEQANGGTIFLDEIDKAGIPVQRRFLHLLDCGEIRAVGGREYQTLDIRVVCATSAPDLRAEVAKGRFIKDLYYRLNDISIHVPPLRERREDVPLLAEYFNDLFAQEMSKEIPSISQMAMRKLLDYDWPGNVRELEKVIRRAVTLADDGESVGLDLLPARVLEETGASFEAHVGSGVGPLKAQLEAIEKQLLVKALNEHDWNKSRSAQALGLSRKGLKNKIVRYELDRRRRG